MCMYKLYQKHRKSQPQHNRNAQHQVDVTALNSLYMQNSPCSVHTGYVFCGAQVVTVN